MSTTERDWTFITNHGLVLGYIYRHPKSTKREIALAVGITERTAHNIVLALVNSGYIARRKRGRRYSYRINPELPLRPSTNRDMVVGDLLKVVAPKPAPAAKRRRKEPPLAGRRLL
ncbi:MAG: winged helix-turn-helix transcriptional regulator [Chloroflexi bacterium]|nr:winged helix-turn-helix transcriptional regulator [Chloroflexota bacterium]